MADESTELKVRLVRDDETGWYNAPASNAIDGDASSRWASDWSDNQSIAVDLGSVQPVSRVVLNWESAYGRGYQIQLSPDGVTWHDAAVITDGDGGTDNVAFAPSEARFVRMQGVQRGTKHGYSLYEFEVYAH